MPGRSGKSADAASRESARLGAAKPHLASLLSVAVENLNDAVLITEGDDKSPRRILYVNPAFTAMTGFSPEDAIGQTPDITIGPETDRATLAKMGVARAAKQPVRAELLKYRKDRSMFWVEIDIIPVFDASGTAVVSYLGMMRDITERKALLTRMLEGDRLASLGTLVAGIAHEMNNPLSYILSNLKYVAEVLDPRAENSGRLTLDAPALSELREALAEVEVGAERVRSIVSDLRVFSRAEARRPENVDLSEILDAALRLCRAELTESVAVTRDLRARRVMGDMSRLGQVFVNLILNAAQAMPKERKERGHVEISSTRDGALVRIEFKDNGVGIPQDTLQHIFQPFFTTKPIGVGTGLGLSISSSIVASLGGRISVTSEFGVGTTMTVELLSAE